MRILRLLELVLFVSLIICIVVIGDMNTEKPLSQPVAKAGNNTKIKQVPTINSSFLFTNSNLK